MKQAVLCYGSRRLPAPTEMSAEQLARQFVKDDLPRGLRLETEDDDGFCLAMEVNGCGGGIHFSKPTVIVSSPIEGDAGQNSDDNDADE